MANGGLEFVAKPWYLPFMFVGVKKKRSAKQTMDTAADQSSKKEVFNGFYKKYSKPFWFFVFKTCGDESMADDVFQESFFRFLRAAPADLNEYQQKAYLYKVAVRLIIDQKRRIRVEENYRPDTDFLERSESKFLLSMDMERVFRLLKPQERTLLWLAHVEGYSHREIAGIMSIKEKTIKVRLFRTRKKFAAFLKQEGVAGAKDVEEYLW